MLSYQISLFIHASYLLFFNEITGNLLTVTRTQLSFLLASDLKLVPMEAGEASELVIIRNWRDPNRLAIRSIYRVHVGPYSCTRVSPFLSLSLSPVIY